MCQLIISNLWKNHIMSRNTPTATKEVTKMSSKGHSLRVRADRWEKIEKKAWKLSIEVNRPIKPTDVADAILVKAVDEITIEDIKRAKEM